MRRVVLLLPLLLGMTRTGYSPEEATKGYLRAHDDWTDDTVVSCAVRDHNSAFCEVRGFTYVCYGHDAQEGCSQVERWSCVPLDESMGVNP